MALPALPANLPEALAKQFPALAQITDRHGNSFYFGNAGDYWHPPFPIGGDSDFKSHVRAIREMEIRDDDTLVCSFPKTGLHWHAEILTMLLSKKTEVAKENDGDTFLDRRAVSVVDKIASPRVMFTHVPFRYLPRQALEKKIKILYLDRNPKDVLVSYYNHMHGHEYPFHYPGTFEHFFDLNLEVGYCYGNMFDYMMEWQEGMEKHPEVRFYTSVYEEMKMDPVEGVVKLNEFLGTGCSRALCEAIADACTFKKMKVVKDAAMSPELKALFKKEAIGFYRKGEVGDWKNWFTVAMNERFDAEFNKWMKGYKRQYIFSK